MQRYKKQLFLQNSKKQISSSAYGSVVIMVVMTVGFFVLFVFLMFLVFSGLVMPMAVNIIFILMLYSAVSAYGPAPVEQT